MIKNIVFDIGGVLIDFDPVRVLRARGLDGEGLKQVLDATIGNPIWKELDRGVMDEWDVIDRMKQAVTGCPGYDADALRGWIDWFFREGIKDVVRERDYAVQWVKYFKSKGLGVYLLSNYPTWAFEMHTKFFSFMQYTDGMVVSGYVKVIKPDRAMYDLLLSKYSLKADECVFIDDVGRNVQGARDAGMCGIQFTDRDNTYLAICKLVEGQNR